VLSLDEETWKSWDGLEQERFIRRLNTKLNYYQRYNEDADRWVALAPDSDPRITSTRFRWRTCPDAPHS
jgi:hypothetical protein